MDTIVLNQNTQLVQVDVPTESVVVVAPDTGDVTVSIGTPSTSVISAGPVGPPGPPGPAGGDSGSYLYTQVDPASSWVINHSLGYLPNVTVEEAGTGYIIMCSEIHHSVTQVELQFNIPRAGTARLS